MTYLEYLKKYHNIDLFIILMDEVGYSDDEIIEKLQVAKGTIYNARERVNPLLEGIKTMDNKKIVYGNPDINTIIEAFKESFGTTSASKYDRYAAIRLSSKHGVKNIVNVIKALSSKSGDQFAPSVNSVSELEKKWVSVGKFLTTQSSNQVVEL